MLPRRVLVVGAGIGGLGASAALAQRGGEVEIVEMRPTHEVLGAGINQPATSLRALRAIRVLHECLEAGFQVSDLRQDVDRVHAGLTEGDPGEFDLVVAFGIKSAMRRRLFGPEHDPVFTGFGVWSARSPGAPSLAGRSTEVRSEEKKKNDTRLVATPGSAGSHQVSGPGRRLVS